MSPRSTRQGRALALAAFAVLAATGAQANPAARTRAFGKLPDWSGIWSMAAYTADAGGNFDDPSLLTLLLGHPPYKPDWEAQYQARLTKLMTVGPPEAENCHTDFPSVMQAVVPLEFAVTPEETVVLATGGDVRHIYTDGKPHTPDDLIVPSLMGDSIGRWKGDTLVVDTIARRSGTSRFLGLVSFSERARFTERIRRLDRDTLEDRLTVEDPVALTQPWTVELKFKRWTNTTRLEAYDCDQNDRYQVIDGKGQIAPVASASPAPP
jgi:hypothetical protein